MNEKILPFVSGVLVGVILMVLIPVALSESLVFDSTLDEVCHKLHGNNTKYVPKLYATKEIVCLTPKEFVGQDTQEGEKK